MINNVQQRYINTTPTPIAKYNCYAVWDWPGSPGSPEFWGPSLTHLNKNCTDTITIYPDVTVSTKPNIA